MKCRGDVIYLTEIGTFIARRITTPIGMAGGNDADKLSYSEQEVDKASVIFDVVALPPVTPLIRYARERGKTVITGSEVFAIQAVEQFVLYTGIRPDDALFQKAAAWSRL